MSATLTASLFYKQLFDWFSTISRVREDWGESRCLFLVFAINVAGVVMALVTIVAIDETRRAGRFNIDSRNNEKVHSLEG